MVYTLINFYTVYRFLATGESYRSLGFSYRISPVTVRVIVPEVCQVIWSSMKSTHLSMPSTEEDWKLIAKHFEVIWNFPHCIGALVGKHIAIQAPRKSGSLYFNYKGFFSVVLMALADAKYKFIYIDVGSPGRNSDGGIFANCKLAKGMRDGTLNIPNDDVLPQDNVNGPMPYVLVVDEAFPLMNNLMRPYPVGKRQVEENQLIFNYRLSRARRIVENTFGILTSRWRIYHTKIALEPNSLIPVVLATCVLHNFVQSMSTPAEITMICQEAEEQGNQFVPLARIANRWEGAAAETRTKFTEYFCSAGSVPWQIEHVRRGAF